MLGTLFLIGVAATQTGVSADTAGDGARRLVREARLAVENDSAPAARRDPIGWLPWRMAGPPVRVRVKTTAPFFPQAATATAGELVATFDQWQAKLVTLVRESEGLTLSRRWMTSPIDARLRYTVYSCLTILPRHQHRHLWQAEQVWAGLRGAAGAA